jgi:signal transduction histidine kinase
MGVCGARSQVPFWPTPDALPARRFDGSPAEPVPPTVRREPAHGPLPRNGTVAATMRRALGNRDWFPARRSSTRLARIAPRRPRFVSSLRARLLASFVGLLAFATLASVLAARALVLDELDERISAELVQETRELRRLAHGNDPETGEPFHGRVERIFDVYLQRNIPSRNEAFLTFVDGALHDTSDAAVPYRLDADPKLGARWANIRGSDRGRVGTPAGAVDYIAVEVRGRARGVFVAATFRDRESAEIESAMVAAGGVGVAVLVFGSLLASVLGARILRPVRRATVAARSISESDLSRRIPVQGDDEIADLARTFNEMLDRLESAFTAQRRLVDDAGHELRTPITIVRGHLELLEDDPQARTETIALVMDELDRMGRIVNDLLLLAKSHERGFLQLDTVDVETLTDELHAKATALAPRDWTVASRGRGVIVADRQRLTQAIVQLAQNAVGHTRAGDPIALGSSVEDGEARFWVRDRGPGIPLDEQERIFDRFARGAAERRSEGAGLGLAIVKVIAEAHHGRVELSSRPDVGSTFTVVVPTDQPEEDRPA